jgi:uncharacterized protein YdeI (BOF family)
MSVINKEKGFIMKVLFVVIALLVAGVVALGFYRGWFAFASDNTNGKSKITLVVDKDKLKEDQKSVTKTAQDLGTKAKNAVAGPAGKISDGTMVSLKGSELTIADKDGKEHQHTIAANVKVTCDGKVCTAADVKAGMRVRITMNSDAPHAVNRIEALESASEFEKAG